jgi:hypothetical protein
MVKIYSTAYINSVFAIHRGLSYSILPRFFLYGKEFRVVFSSAEGFGTEFREYASIFVPRNGIPSCFLFSGRVRNGIPEVSVPRNSRNSVGNKHLFRLFRLPRNYFFVGNSQPYSGSVGSVSFWTFRIRILQYLYGSGSGSGAGSFHHQAK